MEVKKRIEAQRVSRGTNSINVYVVNEISETNHSIIACWLTVSSNTDCWKSERTSRDKDDPKALVNRG